MHFYLLKISETFAQDVLPIGYCTTHYQLISSTREVGMHSSTSPGKNCKQNIVANFKDIRNSRPVVQWGRKYQESLDKRGK